MGQEVRDLDGQMIRYFVGVAYSPQGGGCCGCLALLLIVAVLACCGGLFGGK